MTDVGDGLYQVPPLDADEIRKLRRFLDARDAEVIMSRMEQYPRGKDGLPMSYREMQEERQKTKETIEQLKDIVPAASDAMDAMEKHNHGE